MTNESNRVTMAELIKRTSDKLPIYNEKAIKEIIVTFMNELRDSIIHNEIVELRKYFAFRHKRTNERVTSDFNGEPITIPARMIIKTNFSKKSILDPLNKYYKKTSKKTPGSLYDLPLKDFK